MSKNIMIILAAGFLILLAGYAAFHEPEQAVDRVAAEPVTEAMDTETAAKPETAEVEAPKESEEDHEPEEQKETVESGEMASAEAEEAAETNAVVHVENGDDDGHAALPVADDVIAAQRAALANSTAGKGFGPQSPRDIDSIPGNNARVFAAAPAYTSMNLCNIHFHKNAEHKGGEFTTYAGNGDGQGYQSGYKYDGELSTTESAAYEGEVCPSDHGGLAVGDTIEVHYVHTTAQVKPGATLGACLSDAVKNPQLRVETQVYVLVNDANALDFTQLTDHGVVEGFQQALNIPTNTGVPVQYAGSTTGPSYNEKGSPFAVTWSVRPKVAKVNIASVGEWCTDNVFDEDHAHGVRNLVINPDLLSNIR